MQSTDEKKPPCGGVLDYRLLGQRSRIVGRLLAARSELQAAQSVAADARFTAAAGRIDVFMDGELDALVRDVIPLLEAGPATPSQPGGMRGWAQDRTPAPESRG